MKENNLQKKPSSARGYANLFLLDENGKKRDFSNSKSICLITIGYAETTWILLEEFAGKDVTIIDRKSEIDFIETLIKIHKRNDIRIIRKIEVETDEAVYDTILKLNMNMNTFDLIIANPPFGEQGGNLARKITNKLQPLAQETVVLAPIRSSVDVIDYIEDIQYLGNLSKYFEASCPAISINRIVSKKVCKYKDLADARKSEKQLQFEKAVRLYNSSHEPFYVATHGYCNLKRKEALKDVNEDLLFVVTNWCASDKVHKGNNAEDTNHNLLGQPINWRDKSTIYTIQFDDPVKLQNFKNWWYKVPGRCVDAQRTLIYFILDLLCEAYNGGPSIKKYVWFLPNVDWSKPHDDASILRELGLPEDFLEKEEC